ncbi:response regulator [Spongiibacter taiwanensis]|uniref:response regulator n=1 Tax=Spongiibacter taiwanensis TaxID=1748242 RepID=UPI00203648EF|nr:response regulator [Spongiibacter taiwanensis]USA43164.1 response regulator [Spongiibacter taiwanensis]
MIGGGETGPDPFRDVSDEDGGEGSSPAAPRRRKDLRILVVDHADGARRMLRALLYDIGCRHVIDATDGVSALTSLHNESVDLMIVELHLPGMSGLELLRAVRADSKLRETPVLAVAAEARRQQVIELVQAQVNGFLLRPFSAAMLEAKLTEILASFLRY